jgi:dihydroorotate dehydrogenase (NAD+) catalytic subunit
MKRTLMVDLGGVVLPSPVMIASGCAGTGRELSGLVELRRLGGLVSRSITIDPVPGSSAPRIGESPSGIVWDTGLQNPGLDAFIQDELPRLANGVAAIVSVAGGSLEDYVRLTSGLQGHPDVSAIEVYLSGPDIELDRPVLGHHLDRVTEIVGAVARMSSVPVYAKLPAGGDTVELARAASRAGATGITLLGSPPALCIDPPGHHAGLAGVVGWLSGPALRPVTLRAVFDVARSLAGTPLIASGGVRSSSDAIEMFRAGAWAVQVGTAVLIDPAVPIEITEGIAAHLKNGNLSSPSELRGHIRLPVGEHAAEAPA